MTTLHLRKSISRSPLRLGFLLIPLVLVCFGLPKSAQAVDPPPDGGYYHQNTAEGTDALFSLRTGHGNTAVGFDALYSNTDGFFNTASGYSALYSNTSGSQNTASGYSALYSNTTGVNNTAIGWAALFHNTTGGFNTASGLQALFSNADGVFNTANGFQALYANTTGVDNTAIGTSALYLCIGNNNTAIGTSALERNTTGNRNIALGVSAGANLTDGDLNIDIGSLGVAGEANTIRIGRVGTHKHTVIAGISGVTVAGGVGVMIDSNGQLGTITSSSRYKDNIKPMDKASEAILALKPVSFRYKKELDPDGIPQFGLVAEQVEKVNPDLVARDEQGKPYTVRYEAVNAMLLNEFLKEHRRVGNQQRKIESLEKAVAEQHNENAAMRAMLSEQAAQIQKVSAQLEASKPAEQVVNNP